LHLARRLGRSLAAAGMSVASLQLGGIAAAASSGAAEARREHLTVLPDGISPSCRDRPSSRLFLSALPPGRAGRRVGRLTAARVLGGLATVSVLVEGSGDDLEVSRAAGALARGVAAVPGRVGSPLSSGPHMLIREGARLVRDAADVLELIGRSPHPRCEEDRIGPDLDPDLGTLLEEVARGRDSAEALCAGAADPLAVLSGLTELELAGHLVRGDGGRYLLAGRAPDPSLAR
jgi:DNA processing protein